MNKSQQTKFAKIITSLRNANATSKESVTQNDGVADGIAKVYRSGTDNTAWLEYFTQQVVNKAIKPSEIKLMQNNIGKKATQRKMFSLDDKAKPTQRVRLMKGNKTLYKDGLITQKELDSKAYLWVIDKIKKPTEKTAKDKLQSIINDFNIESLDKLLEIAKEVEFA
jgi:hypothetical protein